MENIKNLLNQVAIVNRKNTEILEASGGRFNIFSICGVNHYENTHSSIIAELLNPKGSHGLKSKFLKCFIETLGDLASENFRYDKSMVFTEYTTDEGRVDILIEDNQKRAIIIENKIYAEDQLNQLQRYDRYAQVYQNGYQILYLTLFGSDASEQSSKGVTYLPISYSETIINWLEKCIAIAARYPIVRETIIQYINHLKQLTNQDMDRKNEKEITEILSKFENLRAAKVILQNYSKTFDYFAEKFFNPKMQEFAKEKGLDYHYEGSSEDCIMFYFTKTDWEGKYWISFSFESNSCLYGLVNNPKNYRISDENIKIIHERLNELNVKSIKESEWWPFYSWSQNLSVESWISDIAERDVYINDCKDKINKIFEAINGLNL